MEQRGEATPREQRSKKAGPQPRGASDPQLLSVAGGDSVRKFYVLCSRVCSLGNFFNTPPVSVLPPVSVIKTSTAPHPISSQTAHISHLSHSSE